MLAAYLPASCLKSFLSSRHPSVNGAHIRAQRWKNVSYVKTEPNLCSPIPALQSCSSKSELLYYFTGDWLISGHMPPLHARYISLHLASTQNKRTSDSRRTLAVLGEACVNLVFHRAIALISPKLHCQDGTRGDYGC